MRALILYRANSEGAGKAEDYAREYHQRHPEREIETINVDSKDGAHLANLYDITNYPAILALNDDNGFLQLWQGEPLPLMSEIDSYANH